MSCIPTFIYILVLVVIVRITENLIRPDRHFQDLPKKLAKMSLPDRRFDVTDNV